MKKFYSEIRVIYADTDAMGVAYHTNYIRWFEIGRTEFLRQIGYPYSELERPSREDEPDRTPIWLPLHTIECTYKSPAVYDDVVEIAAWPHSMSFATVTIHYEISRKGTGDLLAIGRSVHAITDDRLRPIRLYKVNPGLYEATMALIEENEE
ncbi:MAG: acyl-CoA thioesterase [Clostridiales Family XIII bacterium]|jgi:acyl-CoA thioester hydrolase|nr:acyl-CoA thioesterase [Clostridiales Family XIII bacterium]